MKRREFLQAVGLVALAAALEANRLTQGRRDAKDSPLTVLVQEPGVLPGCLPMCLPSARPQRVYVPLMRK